MPIWPKTPAPIRTDLCGTRVADTARASLGELCQRIGLGDVGRFHPARPQLAILQDIAGQVRHQFKVYEQWGLPAPVVAVWA